MYWWRLLTATGLIAMGATASGSMTERITPRNIHSHNDYTRDTPFFDALSYGVMSFEADLHIVNAGEFVDLAVSHDWPGFKHHQSFKTVYLDPLEFLLSKARSARPSANGSFSGLYDNAPSKSIQLLLDYKYDGKYLHPLLIPYLDSLRSQKLLTTYDAVSGNLTEGPITVVCSGSCRLEDVLAQQPRDIFFDAPLDKIESFPYGKEVAPLASASLEKMYGNWGSRNLNKARRSRMQKMLAEAYARDIKTRIWGGPEWPSCIRDATTQRLRDSGVSWISGDNLKTAAAICDDSRVLLNMPACQAWLTFQVVATLLLGALTFRWIGQARRRLLIRRARRNE